MPLKLTSFATAATLSVSMITGPCLTPAQAAEPVVVVGDSLNDTGTFAFSTVTGRFTNTPGLLWTEIVASRVGGRADPARVHDGEAFINIGGTNWAQSGALVADDGGLYNGLSQSVATQITQALSSQIGPDTLVLMDGGGPDVLRTVMLVGAGEMAPEAAIANVQTAARQLVNQAARIEATGADVVLLNVGNFGVFPLLTGLGPDVASFADQLSQAFNVAAAAQAQDIGLRAVQPDIYAWTEAVTGDPQAFGLQNATDPGCDLSQIEETPTRAGANCTLQDQIALDAANTHLFADDVHGSAASHRLLAEYVMQAMSEAGLMGE